MNNKNDEELLKVPDIGIDVKFPHIVPREIEKRLNDYGIRNERVITTLWLKGVFDYCGLILINLFQLEDIYCMFLTSRGFKAFLQHRLDGIAHCTKKTVGSQGSGFDGHIASYVRWMFPTVFFDENGWRSLVCFSCCLHAGMSGGNVFDLAKIASFKPLSEIKLSIGDGSSSSEFFSSLSGFNRCQEKVRTKRVTVFQLMMDSRCDGFYYMYTIGCVFPNLAVLNLVDAENVSSVTKTESLLEAFANFKNLRTLNISGNFDLGVDRYHIPSNFVDLFHIRLIDFSVANNNKINDKFFDILSRFTRNLKSVGIKDCSNVTAECLSFLARCQMIEFVFVPRSFSDHIHFDALTMRFPIAKYYFE